MKESFSEVVNLMIYIDKIILCVESCIEASLMVPGELHMHYIINLCSV